MSTSSSPYPYPLDPNSSASEDKVARTYVFETYSDRDRLYVQFELIRDVFNQRLEQALTKGGLSTDPATAKWRLLDAGCGEGLFSAEIIRRFPQVEVVGFDRDSEAVMTASVYASPLGRALFFTHDVLEPLPGKVENENGNVKETTEGHNFDVALAWLLLMHVKPVEKALANLKAALKPGGVLMLHDGPGDWASFPHPSFTLLQGLLTQAGRYVSSFDFANEHEQYLEKAGFSEIETFHLEGVIGGTTRLGQKAFSHTVATLESARRALVDTLRLISGPEFDYHISKIKREATTDQEGYGHSVITLARKPL